tara:strand:+ start:606 stop:965 length:360 start_codon:yes stop_codon:yes gene_type:complete
MSSVIRGSDNFDSVIGEGFLARAWVNFDGSAGTISARASGNVSGIVDNGTGIYTVSFTTAFSDANYAIGTAGSRAATQTTLRQVGVDESSAPATGSARINSKVDTTDLDAPRIMVSFTR